MGRAERSFVSGDGSAAHGARWMRLLGDATGRFKKPKRSGATNEDGALAGKINAREEQVLTPRAKASTRFLDTWSPLVGILPPASADDFQGLQPAEKAARDAQRIKLSGGGTAGDAVRCNDEMDSFRLRGRSRFGVAKARG